jgi:2-polyprenyl-6-methoxyphenol hydroxylase-like FAD-dependent oxidoreductase
MGKSDDVLIIGGGIGGLALARALDRHGVACRVFERAASWRPAGAGIAIQAAALTALRHIGLREQVIAAGCEMDRGRITTWKGRVLQDADLRFLRAEFGTPVVALHRARLHEVLLRGMGGQRVHLGKALSSFEEFDDRVVANFDDGSRVEGRLLVAADGLHSAVRAQMLGDGPPRYSGYTSWRGIATGGSVASAVDHTMEIWGPASRFGIVPIGYGEIYWFAVRNAPAGGTDRDPLGVVRQHFDRWGGLVPEVLARTAPEAVIRTDIYDRDPAERWSTARVTLIGDAAHPTTPNLGQGGCMAIEDAVLLAHCLATSPTAEAAFDRYETQRRPATAAIVRASRTFGRIGQLEGPVVSALRNGLVRLVPRAALRRAMRQTARFSLE